VAFGVFIAADDLTVVSTMLRQIIGDLGIVLPGGFDRAAWIVNSYLVAYVAVMPFMGRLSDVLGRRRVFTGALVLFLAGSVWIPFTSSLGPFVAGRILTAIGGGAMVPVALAVVGDVYAERRRARPLGVLGAVDTIGWVWGPLFGALLVRYLSWRWQFYLNIPLAILAIAAAWWALADLDRPERRARIDWAGAAALSAALVFLTVALLSTSEISAVEELADLSGSGTLPSLPFFVGSAAAFAVFLFVEARQKDPLIDLGLFRRAHFTPAILVNLIVGAVLVIAMVDVPLFVNLVVETDLERAAVLSGWVLSVLTGSMAAAAYAGGRLTGVAGRRAVVAGGVIAVSGAFGVMGVTWDPQVTVPGMALPLALLGIGFGVLIAPIHDAAVEAAPSDRRGTAGGLVILARLIGLAVGLSGLTAWAIYRFDVLRRGLELPPLGSAGYEEAAAAAQADLSAQALTETFLFSAAVAILALGAALALGGRQGAGRDDVDAAADRPG
jgi:MFS family permease